MSFNIEVFDIDNGYILLSMHYSSFFFIYIQFRLRTGRQSVFFFSLSKPFYRDDARMSRPAANLQTGN